MSILWSDEIGSAGQMITRAIGFRVTDSAGFPLLTPKPDVSAVSGGGSVLSVYSSDKSSPGLFQTTVRLGAAAGDNVFRVSVGSLSEEVTIEGQ